MTQHTLILDYMKEHGSITTFEAYEQLGITKLTTRISELRQGGFVIRQRTESGLNRYGKLVTFNRYWLVEDKENKPGERDRVSIPDAPWIREAERTGFSRYGYFNAPQDATDATSCDKCGELIYLGEVFYDIDGEYLCTECMDALMHRMRRRWGE